MCIQCLSDGARSSRLRRLNPPVHSCSNRLVNERLDTGKKGIYLREQGEHVGPFHSLADAEAFVDLMKLFGENCEGIEIVIADAENEGDTAAVTVKEKKDLLSSGSKTEEPERHPGGGTLAEGEHQDDKDRKQNDQPDQEGR